MEVTQPRERGDHFDSVKPSARTPHVVKGAPVRVDELMLTGSRKLRAPVHNFNTRLPLVYRPAFLRQRSAQVSNDVLLPPVARATLPAFAHSTPVLMSCTLRLGVVVGVGGGGGGGVAHVGAGCDQFALGPHTETVSPTSSKPALQPYTRIAPVWVPVPWTVPLPERKDAVE